METERMNQSKSVFLCCFLFAMSLPVFAQSENGRIEGRVVRSDDSPISGVSVVATELYLTDITVADGTRN